MLTAILTFSLRHRALVILAWIVVATAGALSFARLPLDAFPDTTPVQVQVNVTAPALSPLDIERQITFPVEQSISGLPNLKEVRSVSRFGFAQITAIFDDGTPMYLARQVVGERIQAVSLPPGIDRPKLGPVATGLGEVFHYLVTSDNGAASLAELRTTQDWIIRPQLRSVRGTAEINSWGGDERQIQVIVDPTALTARGLTLLQLAEALERNNANVGGGTIERPGSGEATLVQGTALITTIRDVEAVVVTAHEGVPIRVGDVAKVVDGREIRRAAVTADGKGEVVLGLGFMLVGENSRDVTQALTTRLAEVNKSLPRGVRATPVYERTKLVDHVLATVRNNLLEGAALVVLVLLVFLRSFRAGLLVALAIPLSMLFASSLMLYTGIAGSLMSLGAIDFGLVVDSSVIVVENVSRRLAIDRGANDGGERPVIDVVRDAAVEVRRPTLLGELVIAIVYVPILLLEGVEGKLFRPMALTVIFALVGSMLASMTLVPALASLFLKRPSASIKDGAHGEGRVFAMVKRVYQRLLDDALRSRKRTLAFAVALLVMGGLGATRLGSEFIPRLSEEAIVINTVRLAGVSPDETIRYGLSIENVLLRSFPDEIARVWTRSGTPEVATDPMGIELSDVFITLHPRDRWKRAKTQQELVRKMQDELSDMPGMRTIFTQPIEMRMSEMIAGIRADVGVKIFGDDLDVLRKKAREVERAIKDTPGSADVTVEQISGQPLLRVNVDREAIARHGIPAQDLLEAVAALGQRHVGEMYEGGGERRFPIAIRIDERYRNDPLAVSTLLVTAANGDRIPLARLAKIELIESPLAVQREWGKRRIVVQANVRGRDVGSFKEAVTARVNESVQLPPGYYIRYGGQFEHLERAEKRLFIIVPLTILAILMLLYFTYGTVLDAVRVFTGVPLAAVGGTIALLARGLPFSISAAVGFIAVSGVAVLADMVLVSTIRQLVHDDEGMSLREAIREAAARRLRPVLMTSLVAGLGFIPMAIATGVGAEVQRPLATVVIGGVVSSTLLTLFVVPVLYDLFGAARRKKNQNQINQSGEEVP